MSSRFRMSIYLGHARCLCIRFLLFGQPDSLPPVSNWSVLHKSFRGTGQLSDWTIQSTGKNCLSNIIFNTCCYYLQGLSSHYAISTSLLILLGLNFLAYIWLCFKDVKIDPMYILYQWYSEFLFSSSYFHFWDLIVNYNV